MRLFAFTVFFIIFGLNFVNAQRFGYIDTDFILNKMPEYKKAQDEINQLSQAWEKEVQEMAKKIEGMYSALQAEEVLLTEEMKKERTEAIQKKEAELKVNIYLKTIEENIFMNVYVSMFLLKLHIV